MRYGAPLNQTAPTAAALRRMAALYAGERYLLSIAPGNEDQPRRWLRRRRRTAINVCVAEDASAHDALMAMLQAARLQALLQEERGDGAGEHDRLYGRPSHRGGCVRRWRLVLLHRQWDFGLVSAKRLCDRS